ncbi:MAG: type VI secretion system-associated protein TagF [Rhizobacter sp.]|nr:type VI secretion system-associated protein TagF [Rhizobacter sp.]
MADASPGAPAPGWFGKLVVLGDFAHRRLPQGFVSACDQWLSRGINASRVQLGSQWLDAYLSGPLWRFAWAPGVVDPQWWFGVLMPSVDSVGRYFPLVVAQARDDPPRSAEALHALERWYGQIGQAALATLQTGGRLESFEADLLHCGAPDFGKPPGATAPASLAGHFRYGGKGTRTLAEWAQVLTVPLLIQRYAGHSFWWPMQVTSDDDSMNVVSGLPDPDQFSLMLEGRW